MIAAAHPHLPGMQPHPHPQSTTGRPHLTQPKLTHPGRLHRRHRAVKDSKETVTLPTGGNHRPAMPLDHLGQKTIVPLQRHLHRLRLVSHSRVEPSMSVSRNVSVPAGNSPPSGSPGPAADRRGRRC